MVGQIFKIYERRRNALSFLQLHDSELFGKNYWDHILEKVTKRLKVVKSQRDLHLHQAVDWVLEVLVKSPIFKTKQGFKASRQNKGIYCCKNGSFLQPSSTKKTNYCKKLSGQRGSVSCLPHNKSNVFKLPNCSCLPSEKDKIIRKAWEILKSDNFILEIVRGSKIGFLVEPRQQKVLQTIILNKKEANLMQ